MTSSELAVRPPSPPSRARASLAPAWHAMRDRALRAPLLAKLLGANLLIAVAAAVASAVWAQPIEVVVTCVALTIGIGVNALLVRLALSPLEELQCVAERVSRGEAYVRVGRSAVADARVARLGLTFNHLLDTLGTDRLHIHQVIRRGLAARENERAELACQLREETAQGLSALALQLAAAESAFGRDEGLSALRAARDLSLHVLNDLRGLADATYPGLLQELGLPAALAALAARVRGRTTLRVSVDVPRASMRLSAALVTAMYHAAEEAVRNVERHANAQSLHIRLTTRSEFLRLEVVDDGVGFDVASAEGHGACVGLFQVRELLATAHGCLAIESIAHHGTRVTATARLDQGDTS
jgi:signal transduction histidine kinase